MTRSVRRALSKCRAGIRIAVNSLLGLAGLRLVNRSWGPRGHYPALEALVRHGFDPKLVVDIGAASGTWTEEFLGLFPKAQFLMVDPLDANEPVLMAMAARDPRIHYWRGVAGIEAGEAELVSSGDQSSLFKGSERWPPLFGQLGGMNKVEPLFPLSRHAHVRG